MNCNERKKGNTAYNSTLAIGGVSSPLDSFMVKIPPFGCLPAVIANYELPLDLVKELII
jgi:hypothetical protein